MSKVINVVAKMTEEEYAEYNKLMENHGEVLDRACQAFGQAGLEEGYKRGYNIATICAGATLVVAGVAITLMDKFKKNK